MHPKIANLKLILHIVRSALGCFKGGSCERFAIDIKQISTTRACYTHWESCSTSQTYYCIL